MPRVCDVCGQSDDEGNVIAIDGTALCETCNNTRLNWANAHFTRQCKHYHRSWSETQLCVSGTASRWTRMWWAVRTFFGA